jgi:hypothetical protein
VAIGFVSLAILVLALSYVLLPRRPAISVTVAAGRDPQPVQGAHDVQPSDRGTPGPPLGAPTHDTEIIYGHISTTDGVRVSKVTVQIDGSGRAVLGESAKINVAPAGAYRAVVHLPDGDYRITVTMLANGQRLDSSRSVRLADTQAYDVAAVARTNGVFSFLPVSSY